MKIENKENIKNVIGKIRRDFKENHLDNLISEAESEEPEALCQLGWLVRFYLNDNDLSKKCFLLAGDKNYGKAYFYLSSMSENSSSQEKEYLWQGTALRDPQCYTTLARIFEKGGQYQNALELLKMGTDEGIDECGLELGRRYKKQGNKTEAVNTVYTLAQKGGKECLSQLGIWMCRGYVDFGDYNTGIKILKRSRELGSYRAEIYLRDRKEM